MHSKSYESSKFIYLFKRALKTREQVLPIGILQEYLNSFLQRKGELIESSSRFGTPQYFVDEPSLLLRINQFKEAFTKHIDRLRIFYALKSNSFSGICRKVISKGIGLDVSSGMELSTALSMGCKEIIFSGPGKTSDELMLAIRKRQKVTLLIDSFGELQRLSDLLIREPIGGENLKIGVRIHVTGQWSKFGVPLEGLSLILKMARNLKGVNPCGIQFHSSWNLDPSAQITMINAIGSYIRQHRQANLWNPLRFIDIGGGFWPEQGEWLNPNNTLKGKLIQLLDPGFQFRTIHYFRRAKPLDYFSREISKSLKQHGSPLSDLEVWVEPGRWISTPAMHILLKVIDKKDPRTVITDGGTNLLGWERPLNEFIPLINLTRPSLKEHRTRVFGSLCTPYDVWGSSYFGDGINTGDILLVPDQGAYTFSLRQSFIKPKARIIRFDGTTSEEIEMEESYHPPQL